MKLINDRMLCLYHLHGKTLSMHLSLMVGGIEGIGHLI